VIARCRRDLFDKGWRCSVCKRDLFYKERLCSACKRDLLYEGRVSRGREGVRL
jgi:predicted amidophosphoribosyltransferase